MSLSFSPRGFDDERKRRAEEGEAKMDLATAALGVFALGATMVFPPLAPGFLLAGAMGPVLKYSLTRIRLDPPRDDFFRSSRVQRSTLDPTVTVAVGRPDEFAPDLMASLVAYPVAVERTGAHVSAMVTAVERAAGAYARRSHSAMELRVAEAQYHARHARNAATASVAASTPLVSFGIEQFDNALELVQQFDESLTIEQHLADAELVNLLLASGVDEEILTHQLITPNTDWDTVTPHSIIDAAGQCYDLMESILSDLPPSVQEFIDEGTEEDVSVGEPARV